MAGPLAYTVGSAVAYAMGSVVRRIIAAAGIGFVSYTGGTQIVGQVQQYINSLLSSLDPIVAQAWLVFGGPTALAIIFAAITTRFALVGTKALVSGRTGGAQSGGGG